MTKINTNCKMEGKSGVARVVSLGRAVLTAGFFLVLATVAISGTPKKSPQQSQASGPELSVEGDWVRTDLNGVGSFDGLGNPLPKPELTPAGQAMAAGRGRGGRGGPATTDNTPHAAGDPYVVVSRPCGNGVGNGAGSFNPDSGGFHLIVGKNQVVFSQERGGSRIIYLDGRPQPNNIATWQRAAGHSVGHFENGVLVVDSVGLGGGGFGAPRTPETHLTERFEVSPDGKHMKIEYTYTDPKIYAKPYTYAYTFDRVAQKPSYAFEEWCDAGDPIEGQSIVPPPQQ